MKPEDWRPRGIAALEDNALTVVRSVASYCVVAGPGAGKTELLAQRASYLLETGACQPPRRILAISFKRDAAKNLRERVQRRSGTVLGRRLDSYTFDSFAKGIVDQFLPALPIDLRPTSDYDVLTKLEQPDVEEILLAMTPPRSLGTRDHLGGFASKRFFEDEVPRALFRGTTTLKTWAAREFWAALLKGPRSKLSFKMLMALAGKLLSDDKRLLRAYRATYSHVFLDEFQDTTAIQYWLTKVLFMNTTAVLTAVGDPHQRIMGWAGALEDQVKRFREDFSGEEIALVDNHRASQELAPLVRFLAEQMHASLAKAGEEIPSIDAGNGPPAEACCAHQFVDEDDEAQWYASEVSRLVGMGVPARDIAILVRMKPADYSRRVIRALEKTGIPARVEDAVQELLTEPIVRIAILSLRALGCAEPRGHWSALRGELAEARGLDADDTPRWELLERELSRIRADLLAQGGAPSSDAGEIRALLRTFVEPLIAPVRLRHPQYARGSFYDASLNQLCATIAAESRKGAWQDTLDGVEGIGTVSILTIHKSKGLEYNAVFFLGLEDGAFWNFAQAPVEEMNAFYVAVSRAKRQVMFTFAGTRTVKGRKRYQSQSGISTIYAMLVKAGVHVVDHPDQTSSRA